MALHDNGDWGAGNVEKNEGPLRQRQLTLALLPLETPTVL